MQPRSVRTQVCVLTTCALVSMFFAQIADATSLPTKARAQKSSDDHGYAPSLVAAGLGESEPNDTPAQANALPVDAALVASLTAADVDVFVVDCAGGEWFRVSTASDNGSLVDTVVRVLAADGVTQLAFDDDSGLGLFSSARHVPCQPDDVFYVEVTHFSPTGLGAYQVMVEPDVAPPAVPANDTVATAQKVKCNSAADGTTAGASDQIFGTQCLSFSPEGGDVFYSLSVPYSFQLFVTVAPQGEDLDPALILFTDPEDPWGSCLAANDTGFAGDDELLTWHNTIEGPEEVTVYIAVDSWSPQSAGAFAIGLTCEFLVGTSAASFGQIKARF